jgi:hypothetical protein
MMNDSLTSDSPNLNIKCKSVTYYYNIDQKTCFIVLQSVISLNKNYKLNIFTFWMDHLY